MGEKVEIDGKFFAVGGTRFDFRGVTYGTFASRGDGEQFPARPYIKLDFAAMHEAGFTVVRTYATPPEDLIDVASDWGLRVLAGVFYADWRYLLEGSRREQQRVTREAREQVRKAARRLAGMEPVLGISLGNEVPADVLRWFGTDVVARTIRELAEVVREEDPDQLVTYANYPTAEYLPLETLDFLTFNLYLERRHDFRRYLTRLHHLAGDRPLVLGELGISGGTTGDEQCAQAETLDWQLETAIERGVAGTCVFSWTDDWWVAGAPVEGWQFGLTRADRTPKPALRTAAKWNTRTVRDLDVTWPPMSIVICAFNAEATIDECLRHTCALSYPNLEIIVVDDGSTDATAEIARRHPRVRLVSVSHGGLSVARNEGYRVANGDVIAYLDSDAYPSPEWPYFLALGFDGSDVGGVGGPNLPPTDDPVGADVVARSPGGPVHVLISDDRAEHIPGCNMAFWREVLTEVGGFDPIYRAAGDDVDLCWKLLDRNWTIGFHPAAVVWHHRRPGLRAYLRQQRSYGRSEALVEARHPARFTPAGTARWRGRIYNSLTPSFSRQRVYRGMYGAASYQSVYQGGGHALDLAHQAFVPFAAMLLLTAPLALSSPWLGLPAVLATAGLAALFLVDMLRATRSRGDLRGRTAFRARVAVHHLLQPLARAWGRSRYRSVACRNLTSPRPLPTPTRRGRRGVVVVPDDRPRAELAAEIVSETRRRRVRSVAPSGWEDYDARLLLSPFVYGDLQSSSHPAGFVHLRVRPGVRSRPTAVAVLVGATAMFVSAELAALLVLPAAAGVVVGGLRARFLLRRVLGRGDA